MRPDLLHTVRQERWRQNGNPLLTLDDAERWLGGNPLCLFLPRRAHLPIPAPSFVEAVAGQADATPPPSAVAQASELLARLVASGAAIPLNLFGNSGEMPDFLATPEVLPYLYALQTDRNPKKAPSSSGPGKVSPLAVEAWKTLEREGLLTAGELKDKLGREVTEAAVLRALADLWQTLRAIPIPGEPGDAAHWELVVSRHRKELAQGSTASQMTALSVLISFYVQSAIVATAEEIELFLSPFTSRSRVRDALHGLGATRQLSTLSMEAHTHYFVEGTLPEMPEEAESALAASGDASLGRGTAEPDRREQIRTEGARLRRAPRKDDRDGRSERPAADRAARGKSAGPSRGAKRPSFRERVRPRVGGGRSERQAGGGFGHRDAGGRDRRERQPRPSSSERRPFGEQGKERPTGLRPAQGGSGDGSNRRDRAPFRRSGEGTPARRFGGKPSFGAGGEQSGFPGEGRSGSGWKRSAQDSGRPGSPPRSGLTRSGPPGSGQARSGAARSGPPKPGSKGFGGGQSEGRPFRSPRPDWQRPKAERSGGERSGASGSGRERGFGGERPPRPERFRGAGGSGRPYRGEGAEGRPADRAKRPFGGGSGRPERPAFRRSPGAQGSGGDRAEEWSRPGRSFPPRGPRQAGERPRFDRERPVPDRGERGGSGRREQRPGGAPGEAGAGTGRPKFGGGSFRPRPGAGTGGPKGEGFRPKPQGQRTPSGGRAGGARAPFGKRPGLGGGQGRGQGGGQGQGKPGGFQPPRRKSGPKRRPEEGPAE